MGHTIAEKIIAKHAGKKEVFPGDMVMAKVDLVLANDITAPLAIKVLEEHGIDKVFDNEKIALVMDHFTPAKDIKAATQVKYVREFARKHNIKHYYDCLLYTSPSPRD
jgi:3-isopropylmalate/(R)-2-methylmalate dehydratase large subunit